MNIGIDARMYGHDTRGIGRYIKELISELEKQDTKNTYTIFLRNENFKDYVPKNPNFKKVIAPWRWYTIKEQLFFPGLIKKSKVDFMHFPHFNVPFFYTKPFIVTIHDLILLRASQQRATTLGPLKYFIKKIFYKFIIKKTVVNAKKIIALTEFGKKDIVNEYKVNSKKISVIPQGIIPPNSSSSKIDTNLELRYNIIKPYVIYVGSAYPHKNLKTLILAMEIVNQTMKMQLIFVGKKDFFYHRQEKEYQRDYIVYTDYISDKNLNELYKNADSYIFPSLYEGFGLPPLEAMQNSCPVISADTSCLPEVLGNAAIYVSPNNHTQLAKQIIELNKNQELRKTLIEKGLKQSQKYLWSKTAQKTHNLYKTFFKT